MDNLPMITYWRGRDILALSKDELVSALEECCEQLQTSHGRAISIHEMYKTIDAARKARAGVSV